MLFDPNNGAADRQRKVILVGVFAVWLTAVSLMVWVIAHFVIKFW